MTDESRFWSKVDKSGGPDACWEWKAHINNTGYGTFKVSTKSVLAHRFAYKLKNGPIPDGLCVCHRCDNRPCCNPDHLFLGTNADNVADKTKKGRGNQPSGDRNGSRLHPERVPKGAQHHNAKLTEAQVVEIRALYAAGEGTLHDLGRRFGVSHAVIYSIVRRKTWKHVKEQ